MRKNLFSALACVVAFQASADVDATNPQALYDIFQNEGYRVTLTTDDLGDPKIEGKLNGTPFHMFFYGCTDNANCTTIQFKAGFDMANGWTDLEAAEWNRAQRFSKVYLDNEMDPFIEFDVNLFGGVSEQNFADTIDWWRVTMTEFMKRINW